MASTSRCRCCPPDARNSSGRRATCAARRRTHSLRGTAPGHLRSLLPPCTQRPDAIPRAQLFCPMPSSKVKGEWNGREDPEDGSTEIERKYTPCNVRKGQVDLVIKVYKGGVIDRFPDGGKMSQYMDTLKVEWRWQRVAVARGGGGKGWRWQRVAVAAMAVTSPWPSRPA